MKVANARGADICPNFDRVSINAKHRLNYYTEIM